MNFDLSCERLSLAKYQNGMMLYDPEQDKNPPVLLIKFLDLFALPYSVYLLDKHGATLKINAVGATVCGFQTPAQAIGKTIFDVSQDHSAKNLLDNCATVLQQESVKLFDEFNTRFDGHALHFLSLKFPCYNIAQQLIGTLGISIVIGEHPLAEAIMHLTQHGLLPENTTPNQPIALHLGDVILTPREQACLSLTVKGYTAKQIAKELSLSPRTVEDYLSQLKTKLNVSSKQALIQKVLG